MSEATQVKIVPSHINMQATVVRAQLTAGITFAKMGEYREALLSLQQAQTFLTEIEQSIVDNPSKG